MLTGTVAVADCCQCKNCDRIEWERASLRLTSLKMRRQKKRESERERERLDILLRSSSVCLTLLELCATRLMAVGALCVQQSFKERDNCRHGRGESRTLTDSSQVKASRGMAMLTVTSSDLHWRRVMDKGMRTRLD